MAPRVLMVGLDGLSPELVYRWRSQLPNLSRLMQSGIYGRLASVMPPVTPPAWTAALTGQNPGRFGFWDFTTRQGRSYTDFHLVHSGRVQVESLYTLLPRHQKKVAMLGVPVSFPPLAIPGGWCVSCFLTPSTRHAYTHPPELREEVQQVCGDYLLDASSEDQGYLEMPLEVVAERIRRMDRQRLDLALHFWKGRAPDFLAVVLMGPDRAAHLFYRFLEPSHPRHQADPRFQDAILDHYRFCDRGLGELLAAAEGAVVLVASDHGVQPLEGRLNVNQWLVESGFLRLGSLPAAPVALKQAGVDWPATRAWAAGYGGQIYLNVKGREPEGAVDPLDAEDLLEELAQGLASIPGPGGRPLAVEVLRRQQVLEGPFAEFGPDLFLCIEGLSWTTSDRVGLPAVVTPGAELGPDDGTHSAWGFFALSGPGVPRWGEFARAAIYDLAPTLLHLLGLPVPEAMKGRVLVAEPAGLEPGDEDEVLKRLKALYVD